MKRLRDSRLFINYLEENNKTAYGITTGFADLRKLKVPVEHAA